MLNDDELKKPGATQEPESMVDGSSTWKKKALDEQGSTKVGATQLVLLCVLVLQNTLTALIGRYTRSSVPQEDLYEISHFIFISECTKLVLSVLLEAIIIGQLRQSLCRFVWEQPMETLKLAVPALLYVVSNNLLYIAISNLTVPTFQVTIQTKLVITALVSVAMLKRRYTLQQWCCLVVISIGVAVVILGDRENAGDKDEQIGTKNWSVGFSAVSISCFLSALAGVYFEKVLKQETKVIDKALSPPPSIWMRNIQLAFFSAVIAALQQCCQEPKENSRPFMHDFSVWVWLQVGLFAGGGLLVAAVIKHADNVLKGLATGVSVVLSMALSMVFFETPMTGQFVLGALMILAAVYLFSNPLPTPHRVKKMKSALRTRMVKPHWALILFLLGALVASLSSLLQLGSTQNSTMTDNLTFLPPSTVAPKHLTSPSIGVNEPIVSPADWVTSTSNESLVALRSVRDRVRERGFHEATHVLYDLRTALGNRPVKYLEIGSYTGVSAMLMLSHPMPTFVTAVDPCRLPKNHYHGRFDQESTIRKNLLSQVPKDRGCKMRSPWQLNVGFSPGALPVNETFDIIFIDGDHSTNGVWMDYTNTIKLLRPGGYMVFDDYLDFKDSPAVRGAVDDIARISEMTAIGTPRNVHNIHPTLNSEYINEYIFQKKGNFKFAPQMVPSVASPVLCVAVATYQRASGTSPAMLEKLWLMLQNQSYTNWKLYLTGDSYENPNEWSSLSFYNDSRAHLLNLPEPGERGKIDPKEMWNNAGMAAMNNAIDRLLADGHEWAVHLDDDDYWDADHLQNIAAGVRTGATFVLTRCQFDKSGAKSLPGDGNRLFTHISHYVPPRPCDIVHSSIAFNVAKLPSRYQMFSRVPADAYMWMRIVYDEAFYPAFVPVTSCHYLKTTGPVIRKSIIRGYAVPDGWYGDNDTIRYDEYSTLATDEFPPRISKYCEYVIGPTQALHGFHAVNKRKIPYHIRIVAAFEHLPVWTKLK
jgi:UDP-sugar transporter A1/2/3